MIFFVTSCSSLFFSDGQVTTLERDLAELVSKKCEQSETVLALPKKAMAKFNVTGMTLNEASCEGVQNQTHWVLKTLSTSCGSINSFRGRNPIMKNKIYLKFVTGSQFYGQPVQIPVSCKYPPGMNGFSMDEDEFDEDENDLDLDEDHEPIEKSNMYVMDIFRLRPNLPRVSALQTTVFVGDELKVETKFKKQISAPMSLAVEKCWVTNQLEDRRHIAQDDWLIRRGCPAHQNVTMLSISEGQTPSFTFQVSQRHRQMGEIYLVCVIGLCSPFEFLTKGNLELVSLFEHLITEISPSYLSSSRHCSKMIWYKMTYAMWSKNNIRTTPFGQKTD